MGTASLKQKAEGINELPSYCSQAWPSTRGREKRGDGGAVKR